MSQPTPEIWDHILTLMASIVVSDQRVREDEINSFIKNAHIMANEMNQTLEMSDMLLTRWFEARRQDIAREISAETVDTYIVGNVMALEPFFHKQVLLNCLISIAAADAEIHEKEVDIVNLAAAYWDLPPIRSRS
jgi:Tellurite resistance protein TerB.